MGIRTGNPRGRPKGVMNKRTRESVEKAAAITEQLRDVIPDMFEGDAHTLLMSVYKDTRQELTTRIDAAKAALPYEKPRLVATDATVKTEGTLTIETGVPR